MCFACRAPNLPYPPAPIGASACYFTLSHQLSPLAIPNFLVCTEMFRPDFPSAAAPSWSEILTEGCKRGETRKQDRKHGERRKVKRRAEDTDEGRRQVGRTDRQAGCDRQTDTCERTHEQGAAEREHGGQNKPPPHTAVSFSKRLAD